MAKRLIDCTASELAAFSKRELLASLAGCEGRVLAAETIGSVQPLLADVSNAELAAAMGADLLLLNMLDVEKPVVNGLPPAPPEETVRLVKRLTGRPVGINLEPVDPVLAAQNAHTLWAMSRGRLATAENARRAAALGVDLVVLTGNPGNGVANSAIVESLKSIRAAVGGGLILAAGKMHASGLAGQGAEGILSEDDIRAFVAAGADIVLLPAPGTVPGVTLEWAREHIALIHSLGALALTAIGTSQEGADEATIRQIALMCKMAGADIHHIGDAGTTGIALPQNITAYSTAIRGVRHTWRTMARSVLR